MKLSDIFEVSHGISREPFTIEHELSDGTVVDVTGEVIITPDMYNTGDSPTEYEATLHSATLQSSGATFDLKQLSSKERENIKDRAVESVRSQL